MERERGGARRDFDGRRGGERTAGRKGKGAVGRRGAQN
jgi:hypothetical protein